MIRALGGEAREEVLNLSREPLGSFMQFDDCDEERLRGKAKRIRGRPRLAQHGGSTRG